MPRVLITGFCAVPGPRRAGVQLRHVIRALTPHHNVDLLVVREGDQAYVERQGSVRVLRVPTQDVDPRAQIQSFQRALKRQLEGADYDVVHCRDAWSATTVLEARDRLGYAVVYDLSRSPADEPRLDPALDAAYARDEAAVILAADLLLAPTPSAVRALQSKGRPGRVMLSPLGVDVDRFDWDAMPAGGVPRIVYVGAIDAGRGVRLLVRAMAAIVREREARLVLAGPIAPHFDGQLRDGIRELGLTDSIEILGAVDHDQLPALIATATVCVVPHAAELTPTSTAGFPTKLLEYLACKRAVVAADRETIAQVVDNGGEALLFAAGDPLDLARKVLRVLGEPVLRDQLANAGYDRVRREFTASTARRALRNAYALLAERFASRFAEGDDADRDSPRVEMLTDDEFEATVFEDALPVKEIDTAVSGMIAVRVSASEALDEALSSLDEHSTASGEILPPPARAGTESTTAVSPPRDSGAWISKRPRTESWLGDDPDGTDDVDDGTPAEGSAAVPVGQQTVQANFVAGEIDVPPSGPAARGSVERVTASSRAESDPDTGRRTPLIERRN